MTNKNILITGASSGFGKYLALEFAENCDNITLFLIARRKENLQNLKEQIEQKKKNINVILGVGDVCDRAFIDKFTQDIKVDILVNNAGLALGIEPAESCKMGDWDRMISVNISALVYLTHKILPQMVAQKSGHIINIGSIAGHYAYRGGNVYGASKAFVEQFSRNLRADLFDKNVRVSNIEPGLCDGSDFSLTRFSGDKAKADAVYQGTKPLHAQDVAKIIFWVSTLPPHININAIEVMPTIQASAGLAVCKD
ncbi:SDR family NAD(P)-dependent oxidoreductase [Helicobacter saguini]|uniref:SDR family NAD(P)-dependent oxidoreductase n=1 Tax=Helicobacter saguini TaxID=1548018 RepID=A0A347VGU6_9HELI|nr:SDR family NAD(P)-dependent oxidoreductase [Helicobacter saguini]MWV62035.1 SDR family NAD(P)-dependent oxidoreductase [Helicobacter saguini]MWV67292.1 SDR family NAD(P)-dependent oxidoreductase [Helicobacter saguini]MWV69645.1 SDR family NAD(P)-dependent oxidoreductase [Helicobacter saguini]MWV70804.1 SDR family NAD(P)-dependent oxidoreductase [Helicobacter saguini]TLD94355.1 SDR family NAD(P)-dependent oxidoreductase [Helicobacter saguini]